MDIQFERFENETEDEFLWRIGSLKEEGFCSLTWPELAKILNANADEENDYTESYWRKRYKKMRLDRSVEQGERLRKTSSLVTMLAKVEKQRIRTREQRSAYTSYLRTEARKDDLFDMLQASIERLEPVPPSAEEKEPREKAVYVMLSDVHYGITFKTLGNRYDSSIARERIMKYAAKIIGIGKNASADTCFVSLMGDMVSGVIHTTTRLENRENLIEQVTGVSELTASFLYELSKNFGKVYVNSVDGNHSRIDQNFDDVLRGEKLDAIIPWYCKTRLEQCGNVTFVDNEIDSTIASFEIWNKLYVAVHGDMDNDLKTSAQRIEKMISRPVNYLLAAHMHIPDMRFEDVGFIRNGCVCGSGDEYTVKKRLFGPAMQVCMVITPEGVDAVHPVLL